jgi:hypothetical protein
MDTLSPGYVSAMTMTVSSSDSVVGKKEVPLTVKFTVGSLFPLNGQIIMKFPPHYTHNEPFYTMVSGNLLSLDQPKSLPVGSPRLKFIPKSENYLSNSGTL